MRRVIFMVLIILITACYKPGQRNDEITKVELAESGYFFDFGQKFGTAISIDSDLNFKYYDGNKNKGYYIGKISVQFWDTLNYKLDNIKFKTLKSDKYADSGKGYYELIVHWKAGKKRIIRLASFGNNLIDRTFSWLNNSYKDINLQKANSPIRFETNYQNAPPNPKIDQVKFPPPTKQ